MATIIKKIKKGKPYWYAVESQRVNGKPRIVWQKYLGKVEDVVSSIKNTERGIIKEVEVKEFGAVAALLNIANEINLVELINETIPKRNQGANIGQYILLAALNRAIAPSSKLQIGEWYEKTILQRLWKLPSSVFSSQRFWDAMDAIREEDIRSIEKKLIEKVVNRESIALDTLLYDTTNFTTYISSVNSRNSIAQRGRSKKRRSDLRIVGVAMIVSKDFGIPLLHETYSGNLQDTSIFKENILHLIERCESLQKTKGTEITLIFDNGNRGEECFDLLNHSKVGFITSIQRDQYPELLEIPGNKFTLLKDPNLLGVKAYRCHKATCYSEKSTIIVTMSDSYYGRESSALFDDITKAMEKIKIEARSFNEKEKSSDKIIPKNIQFRIEKILNAHSLFVKTGSLKYKRKEAVIDVHIDRSKPKAVVQYSINHDVLNKRLTSYCGKKVFLTNRDNWTTEEIIKGYRGQSVIEDKFRDMNNRDFLRWQPAFHWTDQKIKVHTFYCFLALLLESLARRKTTASGINLSMHDFLKTLTDIKEVLLLQSSPDRASPPKIKRVYTKLDLTQKSLLSILNIEAFQI